MKTESIREISITLGDNEYDATVEYVGTWSGQYRPATQLDPAEYREFECETIRFVEVQDEFLWDLKAHHRLEALDWAHCSLDENGAQTIEVPIHVSLTGLDSSCGLREAVVPYTAPSIFGDFALDTSRRYSSGIAELIEQSGDR